MADKSNDYFVISSDEKTLIHYFDGLGNKEIEKEIILIIIFSAFSRYIMSTTTKNKSKGKKVRKIHSNKKMVRLTQDDYVRPEISATERLTSKEIQGKLIGYKRINSVEELKAVPKGTHMRYFKKLEDGTYKFLPGGMLINKTKIDSHGYVVFMSNGKTWCATIEICIFFAKKTNEEVEERYTEVIKEQAEEITKLKKKAKTRRVKYDNIDGKRIKAKYVKKREYILVAEKHIKKIYGIMIPYKIKKIDEKVISIRMLNSEYEDFTFEPDDYYFYRVEPKKRDPIRKIMKRIDIMMMGDKIK